MTGPRLFAVSALTAVAMGGCADATEEAGFSRESGSDGPATLYIARVTGTERSESGCLDEIPGNWKPGMSAPCGLERDEATHFEIDPDSAFRATVADAEEREIPYAEASTWVVAVELDTRTARRFRLMAAHSLERAVPYRLAIIADGEVLMAPVPQPGVEQTYGSIQIEAGGDDAFSEDEAADLAARLSP